MKAKPETRNLTLAFVLPLMAAMAIAMLYPEVAESYVQEEGMPPIEETTPETWWYLGLVTVQVVAVLAIVVYFWKDYLSQFPFKVSWLSIPVGVLGIVLWIALTGLGLEDGLLEWLGFDMSRPSFNPFVIPNLSVLIAFVGVRFVLLTIANPIAEELFIRGWLMRWVDDPNFEVLTLKNLSLLAFLSASFYGVLSHPSEAIAAFVWFGLVTLLVRHTGNLWDAFVAHAVTNLLLGLYVIQFEQWQLW